MRSTAQNHRRWLGSPGVAADLGCSAPAPQLTSSLDTGFGELGAQSELEKGVWGEEVL